MPPPPSHRDLSTAPPTSQPGGDPAQLAAFDQRLQTLEEKVIAGFAGLTRSLALVQLESGSIEERRGSMQLMGEDGEDGGVAQPPKNIYDGMWRGDRQH